MSEWNRSEEMASTGSALNCFAGLQVGLILFLTGISAWRGAYPWPELAAIIGLTMVVLATRAEPWWLAPSPFALLLLAYGSLGPFAASLQPDEINVTNLIQWERALFGGLPCVWVQASLTSWKWSSLLDLIANAAYFSHFAAPVTVGLILYGRDRRAYWHFVAAFLGLSYLGFVTYVLFPAAPPWWAHHFGYLQPSETVTLHHFLLSVEEMLSTPNPVAALPSMHCAFPLFLALYCRSIWPRASLGFAVLAGIVGASVVYLGHHYVIDVLAGYLYAAAGYGVLRLGGGAPGIGTTR